MGGASCPGCQVPRGRWGVVTHEVGHAGICRGLLEPCKVPHVAGPLQEQTGLSPGLVLLQPHPPACLAPPSSLGAPPPLTGPCTLPAGPRPLLLGPALLLLGSSPPWGAPPSSPSPGVLTAIPLPDFVHPTWSLSGMGIQGLGSLPGTCTCGPRPESPVEASGQVELGIDQVSRKHALGWTCYHICPTQSRWGLVMAVVGVACLLPSPPADPHARRYPCWR